MIVINGNILADEIKDGLKKTNSQAGIVPNLAIIDIGSNPENVRYINLKQKAAQVIGAHTRVIKLDHGTSREKVLAIMGELNQDTEVDGILLQLPVPDGLEPYREELLSAIAPIKDVDGFNPINRGLLMGGEPLYISCAALACMHISRRYKNPLAGKNILLVGDSFDVIQPLALMFIQEGCHVQIDPQYDASSLENADIAIIEKGIPFMVKKENVKAGALLIDAGFHWQQGRSCGNINPEEIAATEGYLLPVPGGMGPLLIACLLQNLTQAAGNKQKGL